METIAKQFQPNKSKLQLIEFFSAEFRFYDWSSACFSLSRPLRQSYSDKYNPCSGGRGVIAIGILLILPVFIAFSYYQLCSTPFERNLCLVTATRFLIKILYCVCTLIWRAKKNQTRRLLLIVLILLLLLVDLRKYTRTHALINNIDSIVILTVDFLRISLLPLLIGHQRNSDSNFEWMMGRTQTLSHTRTHKIVHFAIIQSDFILSIALFPVVSQGFSCTLHSKVNQFENGKKFHFWTSLRLFVVLLFRIWFEIWNAAAVLWLCRRRFRRRRWCLPHTLIHCTV